MKRAAVLLADGFEEVEALTPVDFLRRAGVEVVTVGINGRTVTGAHDIEVKADTIMAEAGTDFDAVIIPGGMPGAENISKSGKANELIKTLYSRNKLVAAICAAPAVVLAPLGLLSGKKAVCYPGWESKLGDAFYTPDRVVKDGNIITSCGPGTAAEFSMIIIEVLAGKSAADEIHKKTLQK
jgi:4-methyl-5(b-hydroxyethyl)-thiazole monophosphate biosynthesis